MISNKQKERKQTFRRATLILIPLVLVLSLILYIYYTIQVNSYEDLLKEKSSNQIALLLKALGNTSEEVLSDVLFLAGLDSLESFINENDAQGKKDVEDLFLSFSAEKRNYDQIRFIDEWGMEVIRVNYSNGFSYTTTEGLLQDKSEKYYFIETMALSEGEIYVSPLDLNIENGRVVVPLKPMIRIGLPMFDDNGNKKGILIVNFLAETMLRQLESIPGSIDQFMLLNTDGYWLHNSDVEKEWGFMFPEKESVTFEADFPDEWQIISESDSGQFLDSNGLFSFSTIYPLIGSEDSSLEPKNEFQPDNLQVLVGNNYWKAVVYTSIEKIKSVLSPTVYRLLVVFGIFIVVFGIGSWFAARAMVRRKLAETALKEAKNELERKVEERTSELRDINEKLIGEISEKHLAEQASKLKSEFLSYMSHEVRTPLNSVIGFSEILLDGIPGEINEEQKECLTDIHDGGKHLLDLVNDLLDVSKIEAGKMEFKHTSFNLIDVIQDVRKTLQPLIDAKGHTLDIDINEETITVFADASRVRQVLLNLLSNAIKYTNDKGMIRVTSTREGDFYKTAVIDNGVGIKEDDQERVFEVFVQTETLYEESIKGTGLGLTLTKELVEKMGGSIWLESTFGEGSTFFFTLPVEEK